MSKSIYVLGAVLFSISFMTIGLTLSGRLSYNNKNIYGESSNTYDISLKGVVDGDTFSLHINPPLLNFAKVIHIRIGRIQAPELNGKDPCENVKAIKAKEALEKIFSTGDVQLDFNKCKFDKYGSRFLCDPMSNKKLVAEMLLELGLAVKYDGSKKPIVNWCVDKPVAKHGVIQFQ